MKFDLTRMATDGNIHILVTGPLMDKLLVQGLDRLDIDPGPTSIVKSFRDGIFDRITGTYVDVISPPHIFKNTIEHNVFKILSVGNHRFANFVGKSSS